MPIVTQNAMFLECLLGMGITVNGDILPNPGSDTLTNPNITQDKKLKDEPSSPEW